MKIAVVFPGQASQYVGMGKDLAMRFPEAAEAFYAADRVLGETFHELLWNGPVEDLNLTANTQPGVLAVSIAAWRALRGARPSLQPAFLAGHSLGEYSALVAAGALPFEDAVRTVRLAWQVHAGGRPRGRRRHGGPHGHRGRGHRSRVRGSSPGPGRGPRQRQRPRAGGHRRPRRGGPARHRYRQGEGLQEGHSPPRLRALSTPPSWPRPGRTSRRSSPPSHFQTPRGPW